jgi:hypothetical protein
MFPRLPNEALGRSPMSSCLREPRGFEARNSRYGLHPISVLQRDRGYTAVSLNRPGFRRHLFALN